MRPLYWILAWAVLSLGLARAESAVRYAPPSAWVVADPITTYAPTPAADVSYGYDYLLLDNQVSVREQENYAHHVYRITAEGALQSASRVSFDFDPAYQKLTIHHLRVIRAGQVEDRLKTTPAKIIQQERDLDRHLLNGELTALFVLEDIRVGDVVDYAFSRRGWNPALEQRYFSQISTEWAVPMRRQKFRLIAPPERVPASQSHGPRACVPVRSQLGGDVVLTWTGGGSAPIAEEKETPGWYEAYSSIQFSAFTTWAQVVQWAQPLYALPETLPEPVRAQAEQLTRGLTTDEARAAALLHFVQQEIRYLGMELGAGSYRPNPPEVVLARRFGDCKDKTMLFCALARAVGLKAEPALLHTLYGNRIRTWLPTPYAFDHVIAVVTLANHEQQWVDPTLTYQQGLLGARGMPDYGSALIVRAGNNQLAFVDTPGRSTVDYQETFDVSAFDQPARFRVHTTFTGMSADSTRREFAQNTLAELSKNYVNYYASVYPGIAASAPPRMSEDKGLGTVYVDEAYTVPNLWKPPATGGRWVAEFYPKPISDLATRPAATVRTSPMAIAHPVSAALTTTVNLPENWTIKPDHKWIESDAFSGQIGISGAGRVVVMNYSWASKADHILAGQVAKHVQALNQFRESLGYRLTYRKHLAGVPAPAPRAFRLNWMLVLVALVSLTLALLTVRQVMGRYPRQPPLNVAANPALTGLAGWLYVVAIGVTLTPIRLASLVFWTSRHSYSQTVWEALTTPGSSAYQSGLGSLIIVETAGNLLLLVFTVWLAILFYRRHRLFPAIYIATLTFNLLLIAGDTAAGSIIVQHPTGAGLETYNELLRVIVQAAIWIPYMLVSRRVRQTFTN
jgi:transglutaminase-like putative cysteine protease